MLSTSGNVIEAVRHARSIRRAIAMAKAMDETELYSYAKQLQVPLDLLKQTAKLGRLPVVNFAAGGLGTKNLIMTLDSFTATYLERQIHTYSLVAGGREWKYC